MTLSIKLIFNKVSLKLHTPGFVKTKSMGVMAMVLRTLGKISYHVLPVRKILFKVMNENNLLTHFKSMFYVRIPIYAPSPNFGSPGTNIHKILYFT